MDFPTVTLEWIIFYWIFYLVFVASNGDWGVWEGFWNTANLRQKLWKTEALAVRPLKNGGKGKLYFPFGKPSGGSW